jgi:AcrR family transcriptional regulator
VSNDKNTERSNRPGRQALVEAAAQLFREKGYERTTVRDLAAAVGMQSGSLFYHFKTKGEILAEVMQQGIEQVINNMEAALVDVIEPRERLVALTHSHLLTLLSNEQAALASLLYDWKSLPAELQTDILSARNRYELQCRQEFSNAQAAGYLPQDDSVDISVTVRFWLGSINWTPQWYKVGGELSIDNLAEQLVARLVTD